MSIAWQSIQDALPVILSDISGLPETAISWRPLTSSWQADRHIRLQVLGGLRALGVDERRYRYDGGADENLERIYGNRAISISIRVETQDQDLADSAYAIAETVRVKLRQEGIQSRLRAEACLSLSRIEAIRVEDYPDAASRLRSLAILDVTFLTHVSVEDVDVGYFDTANATDTITDPAGAAVDLDLDTSWPVGS